MSNKKYLYPCGEFDDDPKWKCEVGCYCVGCKDCKNYDGTEYYVKNVKKAMSIWAKNMNLRWRVWAVRKGKGKATIQTLKGTFKITAVEE